MFLIFDRFKSIDYIFVYIFINGTHMKYSEFDDNDYFYMILYNTENHNLRLF